MNREQPKVVIIAGGLGTAWKTLATETSAPLKDAIRARAAARVL